MLTGSFLAILRVLVEHHVDFIVVGGVSAVLQGAPTLTFDLDVVHERSAENIGRLLAALGELDARYMFGQKDRSPGEDHLRSSGHQLLSTRFGRLDVLGEIEGAQGYEALVRQTEWMQIDAGRIQVLKLEAYVAIKEASNDDKDRAKLPTLRAALEEKRRLSRP